MTKVFLDGIVYGTLFLVCVAHITGYMMSWCERATGIAWLFGDHACYLIVKLPWN